MITDRYIHAGDMPLLAESLAKDEYHKDTTAEFFTEIGSVCKVYEDEQGPIFFLRGAKALRLDIQFVSNEDAERNKAGLMEGFDKLAALAKANGFTELCFVTNSEALKRFCMTRFGYFESGCELRRLL